MTFALCYFFNYCLYAFLDQLLIYAYSIFQAQPLLFFITASILFIPSEIICPYFNISCQYIDITLNYLYRTIFQLNTRVGYIVRLDDRDIIFDFSPPSEEELVAFLDEEEEEEIDEAELERLTQIQQDIQQDIILRQIQRDLNNLYCQESFHELFPSDEEMNEIENIDITNTDYECVDDDINYDLDDLDCSNFPEDY